MFFNCNYDHKVVNTNHRTVDELHFEKGQLSIPPNNCQPLSYMVKPSFESYGTNEHVLTVGKLFLKHKSQKINGSTQMGRKCGNVIFMALQFLDCRDWENIISSECVCLSYRACRLLSFKKTTSHNKKTQYLQCYNSSYLCEAFQISFV